MRCASLWIAVLLTLSLLAPFATARPSANGEEDPSKYDVVVLAIGGAAEKLAYAAFGKSVNGTWPGGHVYLSQIPVQYRWMFLPLNYCLTTDKREFFDLLAANTTDRAVILNAGPLFTTWEGFTQDELQWLASWVASGHRLIINDWQTLLTANPFTEGIRWLGLPPIHESNCSGESTQIHVLHARPLWCTNLPVTGWALAINQSSNEWQHGDTYRYPEYLPNYTALEKANATLDALYRITISDHRLYNLLRPFLSKYSQILRSVMATRTNKTTVYIGMLATLTHIAWAARHRIHHSNSVLRNVTLTLLCLGMLRHLEDLPYRTALSLYSRFLGRQQQAAQFLLLSSLRGIDRIFDDIILATEGKCRRAATVLASHTITFWSLAYTSLRVLTIGNRTFSLSFKHPYASWLQRVHHCFKPVLIDSDSCIQGGSSGVTYSAILVAIRRKAHLLAHHRLINKIDCYHRRLLNIQLSFISNVTYICQRGFSAQFLYAALWRFFGNGTLVIIPCDLSTTYITYNHTTSLYLRALTIDALTPIQNICGERGYAAMFIPGRDSSLYGIAIPDTGYGCPRWDRIEIDPPIFRIFRGFEGRNDAIHTITIKLYPYYNPYYGIYPPYINWIRVSLFLQINPYVNICIGESARFVNSAPSVGEPLEILVDLIAGSLPSFLPVSAYTLYIKVRFNIRISSGSSVTEVSLFSIHNAIYRVFDSYITDADNINSINDADGSGERFLAEDDMIKYDRRLWEEGANVPSERIARLRLFLLTMYGEYAVPGITHLYRGVRGLPNSPSSIVTALQRIVAVVRGRGSFTLTSDYYLYLHPVDWKINEIFERDKHTAEGVCDEFAALAIAMLRWLNIPTRMLWLDLLGVRADGSTRDDIDHFCLECWYPPENRWIHADPSFHSPGCTPIINNPSFYTTPYALYQINQIYDETFQQIQVKNVREVYGFTDSWPPHGKVSWGLGPPVPWPEFVYKEDVCTESLYVG